MYIVIGANGQVGQEFARALASRGPLLLTHDQIEVSDPASVDRCLQGIECSAIINLAAFHNVNACEDDPEQAFSINAIAAARIAHAAHTIGCRVVYFSSDYVFGQNANRDSPYVESDPVAPLNAYAVSKVAGEHMVRAACANHLIVRTSSVFGAVTSRKGSTFPEMILRRARAGEPLRVVDDQFMSPTYAPDLAQTVIALLDAGATGTVHVTNGGACTWHEFACATLRLAGIDVQPEPVSSAAFPSPARRPAYSALASEQLAMWSVLPPRPWQAALEAYLAEKGELTQTSPA
jgi:dTDP-4-dehydrorhamnose reductase